MVKVKQKVKFLGEPGQIYHIGRKSFPFNVWIEVTPDELKHIAGDDKVKTKFDYNPPMNFGHFVMIDNNKKKAGRKKKKKED